MTLAVIAISLFNDLMAKGSSFAISSLNSFEAELVLEDVKRDCIYGHVGGAVFNSGMYVLSSGARVYDAIKVADDLRKEPHLTA